MTWLKAECSYAKCLIIFPWKTELLPIGWLCYESGGVYRTEIWDCLSFHTENWVKDIQASPLSAPVRAVSVPYAFESAYFEFAERLMLDRCGFCMIFLQ